MIRCMSRELAPDAVRSARMRDAGVARAGAAKKAVTITTT